MARPNLPNRSQRRSAVFSTQTFRFFRDLSRNNRKAWMDANRERYREFVVHPFRALLNQLAPEALRLNPNFDTSGRTGSNFSRINRDIRFAADKSPYRSQMYLMFSDQRVADGDDAQLYLGASAEAVTSGFRIYGQGKQTRLARLARPRAVEHAAWLEQQARKLRPRYESYWYSTEKAEWTRHTGWPIRPDNWKKLKGWIVRRKMSPRAATRASFLVDVGRVFREVFPLYQFVSSAKWKP
jgi:uncharacterized protein (TIGR02453 family)